MKALSLLQPWASLVAWGYKKVETRSWGAGENNWGPIAIHASKSTEAVKDLEYVKELFEDAGIEMPPWWPRRKDDYPLGQIVAYTRLIKCCQMDDALVKAQTPMETAFGAWAARRWAWFLGDVRRVEPGVPCKGSLGIWGVPSELEAPIVARSV